MSFCLLGFFVFSYGLLLFIFRLLGLGLWLGVVGNIFLVLEEVRKSMDFGGFRFRLFIGCVMLDKYFDFFEF